MGGNGQAQQQAPESVPVVQQLAQTGGSIDANALISQGSTPEAQKQIANLLGQISQLTGNKSE